MSETPNSAGPVTELKASAHLMLLDPGVFCIFNTPGAAPPDGRTGLPGVRVSPAPAPGAFRGEVSLSGFDRNGWLGADGAALVRVSGGPAQVLVTIYQAQEGGHEAPKLQVLRLSGAAQPAPQPLPQRPTPQQMEVAAHIYGRGDVLGRLGEWMGERGSRRWIEGFALQPAAGIPPSDIEYQAVLGRGWLSPWAEGGQFCGSRGMSLPILGLRVRLKGASARTHSVAVAATFIDGSQAGPVGEDQACESPSLAALEAFVVQLQPKPAVRESAPAAPSRREAKPAADPEPAPTKPKRSAKPAGPARQPAARTSTGRKR